MGTLQVGGTTLGVKNTVTNKVDLSNVGDVTLTSSADIKGAINASGDAPIYACRAAAHVEFASDYSTQSVTKFLNVSSVTIQTADGDQYTVNFTTALPDAAYVAVVGSGRAWSANQRNMSVLVQGPEMTRSTSACQFGNVYANTGSEKMRTFNAAFFSE